MSLGTLLVLALAAWRVTRLITADSIFAGPREAALRRLTAGKAESKPAELLTCAWCMGMWVSAAVVGGYDAVASVPIPVYVWLAVAAAVGILASIDQR